MSRTSIYLLCVVSVAMTHVDRTRAQERPADSADDVDAESVPAPAAATPERSSTRPDEPNARAPLGDGPEPDVRLPDREASGEGLRRPSDAAPLPPPRGTGIEPVARESSSPASASASAPRVASTSRAVGPIARPDGDTFAAVRDAQDPPPPDCDPLRTRLAPESRSGNDSGSLFGGGALAVTLSGAGTVATLVGLYTDSFLGSSVEIDLFAAVGAVLGGLLLTGIGLLIAGAVVDASAAAPPRDATDERTPRSSCGGR